ncbi:MAG: hypothetical protein ACI8TQ_003177 [Planctomycetota bacterium]
MNWEAIGAVGEVLGAVAVILTLGYLAVQVRQSNRAMKSTALNSLFHDVHLLTRDNDDYNALVLKSLRGEALAPDERLRVVERFFTILRAFEGVWFQVQHGAVTQEQFDHQLDLLRFAINHPVARRMWAQLAPIFAPGFQAVVDSEVLSEDAPTSRMLKAYAALDPDWVNQG